MTLKNCGPDYFLDITRDVCPITFVKVRLQIEKMSAGDVLDVRLQGAEPLRNVPDSVTELGHEIRSVEAEGAAGAELSEDTVYRVLIRKR